MKNLLLLLTFTFLLLTSSFAQQGVIQLPATGQTISYYPGDDGDLQMGIPIPANRFTNHGDGSCTDALTGLMWATDANLIASRDPDFDQDRVVGDGDINWKTALDYIQKLNDENYLGHNDWRMPNCMELRSLVNLGNDSITFPENHPFTNLKEGYWSSTTYDRLRGSAIIVFLSKYYLHANITYPAGHFKSQNKNLGSAVGYFVLYLLPVRDGGTNGNIEIPKSGQLLTYYTGDDAAIGAGTPWPTTRLIDNKDGSITDRLTGLMWTKDMDLMYTRDLDFGDWGRVIWTRALDYVAKLNNENYLGYNDWRLPNRNELTSLIDYSRHHPDLPQNHPFITTWHWYALPIFTYWSASTLAYDPNEVWLFNFDVSILQYYDKTYESAVWPVRSDNSNLPAGSIHGYIDGEDIPKKGVEITLEGPVNARTETNVDGYYEFTGLPNGNYTLSPSYEYFAFTPLSKSVNVSGTAVGCNFTAAYNRAFGWVDISSNLFAVDGAAGTGLTGMYFINDDEGWVTSSTEGIYHTVDGGLTFEKQSTELGGGFNAVFMFDENEGYAGGNGGVIYHTVNGGDEWTLFGFTGGHVLDISFPPNSTTGYSCGVVGRLWQISPDGLEQIVTGINSDLMTISTPSVGNTYFNGSTGSHLWHYDGNEIVHLSTFASSVYGIHFHNDTLGWMVGGGGSIGGSGGLGMYKSITFIKGTDSTDHTFYNVHSPNGKDVWAVGVPGVIYYSPNGNDFYFNEPFDPWNPNDFAHNNTIWYRQAEGLTNGFLVEVFFTSSTNGYASGGNGTLLKYTLLEGAPEGADILGIRLPGQLGEAIVNKQQRTVTAEVLNTTDLTKLVPEIFPSAGATVDPPSGTKQDFTNPVVYKITASDGTFKNWTVTVIGVDGVAEFGNQAGEFDVSIYPNPAVSEFKVQSSKFKVSGATLELYGLDGRKLLEKTIAKGTETAEIDVSGLQSGLYFCRISTDKYSVTKKLIIQK